jgi:hypothetical protein
MKNEINVACLVVLVGEPRERDSVDGMNRVVVASVVTAVVVGSGTWWLMNRRMRAAVKEQIETRLDTEHRFDDAVNGPGTDTDRLSEVREVLSAFHVYNQGAALRFGE